MVDNAVEVWSAQDIRDDSPEDADIIDDSDVGLLFHSGGGDGALIIGSRQRIAERLREIADGINR